MNNESIKRLHLSLGPLMIDVDGYSLEDADGRRLLHPLVGGVILFARNYENPQQLQQLTKEIRRLRHPELLIAVDQEGGRVQRFKTEFARLPALASFGHRWQQDRHRAPIEAFQSAQTMASELIAHGIDFSFAPVLDLNSGTCEVIGDRSFHGSPEAVIELASAYIDGMNSAGMVAIGKHFPGHGFVEGDSHHCLPEDRRELDEIESLDLEPYRQLNHALAGVMTAHVLFTNCDDAIPTFSEYWLKKVLRQQIGFEGAIFSDDLSMQGAAEQADTILQRAQQALAAGCDMLLICNDSEAVDELLKELKYTSDSDSTDRRLRLKQRRV